MGALVKGQGRARWEELLAELHRAGALTYDGENIFQQLRIGVDALADPQTAPVTGARDMFLDVACALAGRPADEATVFWTG